MKHYVDAFVFSVPKKNLKAYQKMASDAGKVWMRCGALQYVESRGDDIKPLKGCFSFPQMVKPKKGEVIFFSWIFFKSKSHRNQVNAKARKDPLLISLMEKPIPFDTARMAYGGFVTTVDLKK